MGRQESHQKVGCRPPIAVPSYPGVPTVTIATGCGHLEPRLRHGGEAGLTAGSDDRHPCPTHRKKHTLQEVRSESDPQPGSEPGKI